MNQLLVVALLIVYMLLGQPPSIRKPTVAIDQRCELTPGPSTYTSPHFQASGEQASITSSDVNAPVSINFMSSKDIVPFSSWCVHSITESISPLSYSLQLPTVLFSSALSAKSTVC